MFPVVVRKHEGNYLSVGITRFTTGGVMRRKEFEKLSRVAFVAHALLPGELSTRRITDRLDELGRTWPEPGSDPGHIRWFSFPVMPEGKSARSVLVDFYIIPLLGMDFWSQIGSGGPRQWAIRTADDAVDEALRDGVPVTVGWGAFTKNATTHGDEYMRRRPDQVDLNPRVATTHGDAGSVALVLEAMRRSGVRATDRVAVLGAAGSIGDALCRMIPDFLGCHQLLLVGNQDKPGETRRLELLKSMAAEVEQLHRLTPGSISVSQDITTACIEHQSTAVIVATNGGVQVRPDNLPEGCTVFDITTPAACRPDPAWSKRRILVLKAGCGRFEDAAIIPEGFGVIKGERIDDVGAGGRHVLWGCTLETIARQVFGWHGHLVGAKIPLQEVRWCLEHFPRLAIGPQLPVSFGTTEHTWGQVKEHVVHVPEVAMH